MDFSYAFLKKTLEAWPFIVMVIITGFAMRFSWNMALRWDRKHIVHHLPEVIQIELSKKDIIISEQANENKKLRDAVDRLWVDNKMINKAKVKK